MASSITALISTTESYLVSASACGISYTFSSTTASLLVSDRHPVAVDAGRPAREVGRLRFTPESRAAPPPTFIDLSTPRTATLEGPNANVVSRVTAGPTERSLGYFFHWSASSPAALGSLPARVSLRSRVLDTIPALRDTAIPLSLKVRYFLAYIYPAALYGVESLPRLSFSSLDAAQSLFTAHSLLLPAGCMSPSGSTRRRFLGLWPLRVHQGYMASITALRAVRVAPDGLDLRFQARLRVELSRPKRELANPDSTLALVARFLVCDLGVRGLDDDSTATFFALFVGFAGAIDDPAPEAGRYWWRRPSRVLSDVTIRWSAPSLVYTQAKSILRRRIARARDADGVSLGRQGPPPALKMMGPNATAWLVLTADALHTVGPSRENLAGDGACPLCFSGILSHAHIIAGCSAPSILSARVLCSGDPTAWRWITHPPRSLQSQ